MLRCEWIVCLALAPLALALVWPLAVAAAEMPSAEEILKTYQRNKERLSQLHVQTVHVYEMTEAGAQAVRAEIKADAKEAGSPEQRRSATMMLPKIKPFHMIEPVEFFLDGQRYQRRGPVQADRSDAELKSWRFPSEPLTPQSLPTAYREVRIFSCLPTATPAVRIWSGDDQPAYISQLHLDDSMLHGPPLIDARHYEFGQTHPIDDFFSWPAKDYRVLRQETIDGRLLTLVELVPPPGEVEQTEPQLAEPQLAEPQPAQADPEAGTTTIVVEEYAAAMQEAPGSESGSRAWIDLARGALPMRIETNDTMATQRVVELPNGAFYPAQTVQETLGLDPAAPPLTSEQWADVRAGKRKAPLVVHQRSTWDCSLIELKTGLGDDFFAFAFPERQPIWDQDTGKMVGALEAKPLVGVGRPAPPLAIGRWVDGKERTLEGLRGQVVVLSFGAGGVGENLRHQMLEIKALQDRFAGKPVVFITIHAAEQDPAALAANIEAFQKKNHLQYIAAIDAGHMFEDSATRCEYGVGVCPQRVIIGRDGKISYVDPKLDGPSCDEEDPEIMAAWKEAFDQHWQERFKAVGETWPLPWWTSQRKQFAACQRVEGLYYTQQIEAALGAKH